MRLALLFVLAVIPGFAQPQPSPQTAIGPQSSRGMVTKIIHVAYGNPHKLANLAAPGGMHVNANADEVLQVIVLTGEPSAVASAEQTIHQLDVPPRVALSKNVELIVLVVGGSNAGTAAPDQASEDLGPVIKQLRGIFPYKNYQVLSSMLLRSREGEPAGNDGAMGNLGGPASDVFPSVYSLHYDHANVSFEGGKPVIHLKNFRFQTHIDRQITKPVGTTQLQRFDIGIGTGVDIREGQRIVAGKANIDSSDSALFVVLTARLVD